MLIFQNSTLYLRVAYLCVFFKTQHYISENVCFDIDMDNVTDVLTKRKQHEAFVSGFNGTTILEITLITSLGSIMVLMRNCISLLFFGTVNKASTR